jgi:hypothetical protein
VEAPNGCELVWLVFVAAPKEVAAAVVVVADWVVVVAGWVVVDGAVVVLGAVVLGESVTLLLDVGKRLGVVVAAVVEEGVELAPTLEKRPPEDGVDEVRGFADPKRPAVGAGLLEDIVLDPAGGFENRLPLEVTVGVEEAGLAAPKRFDGTGVDDEA